MRATRRQKVTDSVRVWGAAWFSHHASEGPGRHFSRLFFAKNTWTKYVELWFKVVLLLLSSPPSFNKTMCHFQWTANLAPVSHVRRPVNVQKMLPWRFCDNPPRPFRDIFAGFKKFTSFCTNSLGNRKRILWHLGLKKRNTSYRHTVY